MLRESPTRPGTELLSNFIFRDFKGISEMLVTQTLLLLEIFHSYNLLCGDTPHPPVLPPFRSKKPHPTDAFKSSIFAAFKYLARFYPAKYF